MNRQKDAQHKFRSLDVPFHYDYSFSPPKVALYNHKARSKDEWNLTIGEKIHQPKEWHGQAVNGRGWDGYFYGSKDQNLNNSDESGYKLYPNYKMRFNMSQL
jgi:hypothetical protein